MEVACQRYDTALLLVFCPILEGLCTCAIWSSMSLHAKAAGIALDVLGWVCAAAMLARIFISQGVVRFGAASALPTLLCFVACASVGFAIWDTSLGFFLTVASCIAFSQRPIQQVMVRETFSSNSDIRRATGVYEASFTVGYCVATLAGGWLYEFGPFGRETWRNNAAAQLTFAVLETTTTLALPAVWRRAAALARAAWPGADTTPEAELRPAPTPSRPAAAAATPNVPVVGASLPSPRRRHPAAVALQDPDQQYLELPSARSSSSVRTGHGDGAAPHSPAGTWPIYFAMLGSFANNFAYTMEWALYALFLKEHYDWGAAASGTSQMAGDALGAIALVAMSTRKSLSLKSRRRQTGDDVEGPAGETASASAATTGQASGAGGDDAQGAPGSGSGSGGRRRDGLGSRTMRAVSRVAFPPFNLGLLLSVTGVLHLMFAVESFYLVATAQIAMGTTYVFGQQAITAMVAKVSRGDADVYKHNTVRVWQALNAGGLLANFLCFVLYNFHNYAPFLVAGATCLLSALAHTAAFCCCMGPSAGRSESRRPVDDPATPSPTEGTITVLAGRALDDAATEQKQGQADPRH